MTATRPVRKPTEDRAIRRAEPTTAPAVRWHCMTHNRDLTDKTMRVYHPYCAVVSANETRFEYLANQGQLFDCRYIEESN